MSVRVLMIEDEKEFSDSIISFKRHVSTPFSFLVARTLIEGLAALGNTEQNFDVILLDLNLPDSQGVRTLKAVRQATTLPIIVITGGLSAVKRAELQSQGARDVLEKPETPTRDIFSALSDAADSPKSDERRATKTPGIYPNVQEVAPLLPILEHVQRIINEGFDRFERRQAEMITFRFGALKAELKDELRGEFKKHDSSPPPPRPRRKLSDMSSVERMQLARQALGIFGAVITILVSSYAANRWAVTQAVKDVVKDIPARIAP